MILLFSISACCLIAFFVFMILEIVAPWIGKNDFLSKAWLVSFLLCGLFAVLGVIAFAAGIK